MNVCDGVCMTVCERGGNKKGRVRERARGALRERVDEKEGGGGQ